MMRIWFDTEFIEDGKTIDLLSIGMVREDGWRYYAEPMEADLSKAGEWVKANVLPHLSGKKIPRAQIAQEIVEFAGADPEFWAYFASYDWVALCQLYGTMMDLPASWPMYCRDFKQVAGDGYKMPPGNQEHNALADAVQLQYEHTKWEATR
jgi:hypothetical protein